MAVPSWEGQPVPTSSLWSSSRAKGSAHAPITKLHVSPLPTPDPNLPTAAPPWTHISACSALNSLCSNSWMRELSTERSDTTARSSAACSIRPSSGSVGGGLLSRVVGGHAEDVRGRDSVIPGGFGVDTALSLADRLSHPVPSSPSAEGQSAQRGVQEEMSPLQPRGSKTSPTTWGPPEPHLFLTPPSKHCLQRTPWHGVVCGGQVCGTQGSKHCCGGSRAHGGSSSLGSRSCSSMEPHHHHPMGRRGCSAGGALMAHVPSCPHKRVPPAEAGRLAGSQPASAASPCSQQCLLSTRTPCPS